MSSLDVLLWGGAPCRTQGGQHVFGFDSHKLHLSSDTEKINISKYQNSEF